MSRLIESIRLENGTFYRLPFHQARMDSSVVTLWQRQNQIDLASELMNSEFPTSGVYKCRVLYTTQVESIDYSPYSIRPVQVLRCVEANNIDYAMKSTDRDQLNQLFAQRGDADDVLIIRQGVVTDASYSNVVFFDGHTWFTPDTPLLRGVMREALLQSGTIHERRIRVEDIPYYKSIKLINAMLGWDGPVLDTHSVVF